MSFIAVTKSKALGLYLIPFKHPNTSKLLIPKAVLDFFDSPNCKERLCCPDTRGSRTDPAKEIKCRYCPRCMPSTIRNGGFKLQGYWSYLSTRYFLNAVT